MIKKESIKIAFAGILIGIVNGLFGAGGGMIAVPVLEKIGLQKKDCHTNALAVILPISVLSAAVYLINGSVKFSNALIYIPTGLVGALLGTYCLRKITPNLLRKIFNISLTKRGEMWYNTVEAKVGVVFIPQKTRPKYEKRGLLWRLRSLHMI